MVHLISYDLNGHERPSSYQGVRRLIERHAIDFRRPLYSQWLVQTSDSVEAWTDRLTPVIDPDDNLLVTRIPPNPGSYQGFLAKEIWSWLNARV